MTVLAIDTAGAACAVALRRGDTMLALESEEMERGQAEELTPMIARVMREAGVSFPDLDLVAVTVGPGSFTGLRIGLATARGIGLAGDIPVGGISSFDVVAAGISDALNRSDLLAVVLETKRQDYYARIYNGTGRPLSAGAALAAEELAAAINDAGGDPEQVLLAGDGSARALLDLTGNLNISVREAPASERAAIETVAMLAQRALAVGEALLPADPVYLRPPDVRLPGA